MAGKRTNGSEAGYIDTPDGDEPVIVAPDGDIISEDSGDALPLVEPSTLAPESEPSDGGPRRRGRPRGTKSATKSSTKQTATDLTAILMSLHFMGAEILKVQELKLDKPEAEQLAQAIARVQSLYDMPILSEKQLAWFNLLTVAGAVYGPRIMAHSINKKKARTDNPPQTVEGVGVVH